MTGFKARMTFDNCLQERNETLYGLFGSGDIDQISVGSAIATDGRSLSAVLETLPVCDLQQELDNVSAVQRRVAIYL